MGLINLSNGHFQLPAKTLFFPGTKLDFYQAAFGKDGFQFRWEQDGYEEYHIKHPLSFEGENYGFACFFKYKILSTVHIWVSSQDEKLASTSEEEDYAYYRKWLEREVGPIRQFVWGHWDIAFDQKSQFGYIELRYKTAN